MEKKIIIPLVIIILAGGLLAFSYLFWDDILLSANVKESSFSLDPPLFKISINEGETISTSLNIKNLENREDFELNVVGVEEIVSLEKSSEMIRVGEAKNVRIQVSGFNVPHKAYMGHISVSDGVSVRQIPVIVSFNTKKQYFAISLSASPENKQMLRGENLDADIKIFNLGANGQREINVNYEILDIQGNSVYSDSEILGMESKLAFIKKVLISEDLPLGDYSFVITIKYSDSVTSSTYLFSIVDKRSLFLFPDTNFFVILVSVFVAITFILIIYMLRERNRLFSKMNKQHLYRLMNSSKGIALEEKKCLANAKDIKERRKITEQFKDARKKILGEMKKQHKKHLVEIRNLKESKKEKENKIKRWDNESYSKALEAAKINQKLKDKLAVLKKAYSDGMIKKESYDLGVSELESMGKKIKRNVYK